MQKTVQDLKKLSNQGQKLFKGFFYWAYIPVVVILGLKTVDWANFTNPQPQMWLIINQMKMISLYYFFEESFIPKVFEYKYMNSIFIYYPVVLYVEISFFYPLKIVFVKGKQKSRSMQILKVN